MILKRIPGREIGFAFAAVFIMMSPVRAGTIIQQAPEERPNEGAQVRNLVFFIADGFGPAGQTLGREVADILGESFVIDDMVVGTVGTKSVDSRVTDSAAGGTALACGVKTLNGVICMDADYRRAQSIVELAHEAGKATGVVATSTITHATPASFSSHVPNRNMEHEIAAQQMASGIDVFMGGGLSMFLPVQAGGSRPDGRNLLKEAAGNGRTVVTSPLVLGQTDELPIIALFGAGHMAYEVDRDPRNEPSLAEMTQKAIGLLSKDEDGFVLMVEASRIDHAAHEHDPIAFLHDILAYDDAVEVAVAFARKHPGTLVVTTADHETGGLTLGRDGIYAWHPEVLIRADRSIGALTSNIDASTRVPEMVRQTFGFAGITADEETALVHAFSEGGRSDFRKAVTDIVNRRAGLAWSTGAHTGVDVYLGAFGAGTSELAGFWQNDELGRKLAALIGVDLTPVDTEKQRTKESR